MSSNVVWDVVRKTSAFRVKRNGVEFSREKGNLTNRNTFKYSGLAQKQTVDVNIDAKGKASLSVSVPRRANKVAKAKFTVRLARGSVKKRNSNIRKTTADVHFRKDLQSAALARFTALHKSLTRKVAGVEASA